MTERDATRQRSWSFLCRYASVLAGALGFVFAAEARADVLLAPSADGHFGAFLAAGPVPSREPLDAVELHPAEAARVSQRLGWLRWTVADGGKGAFDLGHVFGATAGRGVLAGELVLPTPFDGWLLISADGALTASVDGKPVFRREVPRSRGGGWDPVALVLAPGVHTLVFDFVRQGRVWFTELRLLAGADLEPPAGARLRLPAVAAPATERLTARLADVRAFSGVVPGGFQPQIRVEFPRGAPVEAEVALSAFLVSHGTPTTLPISLGRVRAGKATESLGVLLPALTTAAANGPKTPDQATVRIGATERSLPVRFDGSVAAAVARGLALRQSLLAKPPGHLSDVETCVATLESRLAVLGALESNGDAGALARAKRLVAFVDRIEAGGDPLHDRGVLELARRSRIDGEPDALSLHVPATFAADSPRKYPLVVVLHGYGGNAERVMAAFLGTDSLSPHPRVDGFVLAPYAHGDAFYRGPGETEVMDAIDWAVKAYPIDRERISVTGISMGGTGAAHFAFRFADRFSAVGALAGYHSFFVRRDVLGRALRPWEIAELTRWSPASFAENGRDLPLLVAQGTSDLPLSHSRSLADRYRALGYPLRETWPDIGHDVWRVVWGNAELWPWLTSHRATAQPKRVTIKADSLRLASRAWARITAFGSGLSPAELDVTLAKDRVLARASGVDAFELRPREAGLSGPASLELEGLKFEIPERDPILLHRVSGAWTAGPLPKKGPGEKRPSVEGPIRDAFNGPLAFVYGTLDDRQTNAAREVAEHFRNRWAGDTRFPVLADRAVPRRWFATHSLFLVGGKDSNLLVRELDPSLPLGVDGRAVRAGRARLQGDGELGTIFVYPNPKNPDRYVVAVEAVSAAGLFRAESLPSQLPDFIVFDSGVAPAAGQQVLGDARVLGAGYFDRSWALPSSFGDATVAGVAGPAEP